MSTGITARASLEILTKPDDLTFRLIPQDGDPSGRYNIEISALGPSIDEGNRTILKSESPFGCRGVAVGAIRSILCAIVEKYAVDEESNPKRLPYGESPAYIPSQRFLTMPYPDAIQNFPLMTPKKVVDIVERLLKEDTVQSRFAPGTNGGSGPA